jgi:hypothetical protein
MPLAEDQDMIQALAPKRSDQTFQRMDSATATSVTLGGRESVSGKRDFGAREKCAETTCRL